MAGDAATELILIRHAPAAAQGRLCGRSDVAADCSDLAGLAALRLVVGDPGRIVVSPALRCRQTAAALWPGAGAEDCAALWEQDFGIWEGRATADIPDLGPMASEALAAFRPPGGESFADLCARAGPALMALTTGGRVTVVAHAGTVRAALALAFGSVAPALAFAIAPLSVTRVTALPGGAWSVGAVNWRPA